MLGTLCDTCKTNEVYAGHVYHQIYEICPVSQSESKTHTQPHTGLSQHADKTCMILMKLHSVYNNTHQTQLAPHHNPQQLGSGPNNWNQAELASRLFSLVQKLKQAKLASTYIYI